MVLTLRLAGCLLVLSAALAAPACGTAEEQGSLVGVRPGEEQRIASMLHGQRIDMLSWSGLSWHDAIQDVRTLTGVRIEVTPDALALVSDSDDIDLPPGDASLSSLLSIVLTEPYCVRWELKEDGVRILSAERQDRETGLRTRFYSLAFWAEPDGPGHTRASIAARDIRSTASAETWSREGVRLERHGAILRLRAPPAVQEAAQRIIGAALERAAGRGG